MELRLAALWNSSSWVLLNKMAAVLRPPPKQTSSEKSLFCCVSPFCAFFARGSHAPTAQISWMMTCASEKCFPAWKHDFFNVNRSKEMHAQFYTERVFSIMSLAALYRPVHVHVILNPKNENGLNKWVWCHGIVGQNRSCRCFDKCLLRADVVLS